MFKLNIIIISSFFVMIYAPGREVGASQVLPLVFFLKPDQHRELQPPDRLDNDNVVIDNGQIVNGTKFTLRIPGQQMFFCPKEDPNENCMEPREFQGKEPLQCTKEAIPVIPLDNTMTSCGMNSSGTPRDFVYQFCPGQEPYISGTKRTPIYKFCYDEANQKTLFTNHYIMSPELLNSEGLIWERQVNYPMETVVGFTPSIQLPPQIDPNAYAQQTLVPSEDMAFALWRKPTFQLLNVDWQHKKIIQFWNYVNNQIRIHAEKIFAQNRTRIYAETGVFQLSSSQRNDGQLSNVWIKLLYTMSEDPKDNSMPGVVIMMNNFIDKTNQAVTMDESNPTIDNYCEKNWCAESLTSEVHNVGSKILCCTVNNKVRGIFGGQYKYDLPPLHIPNVTKPIE